MALASTADLAIIPIQDYLCLGNEARINAPSTIGKNWQWRMKKDQISDITLYNMNELTRIYGRKAPEPETEEEAENDPEETEDLISEE